MDVIKGFNDYTINKDCEIRNIKTGRLLKSYTWGRGYLWYKLYIDKKPYNIALHRLIMMQYTPNPNNYPCVNHIDGNKLNNSLDNLEWCTYSHNLKHAYATGLKPDQTGNTSSKMILNTETGIYYKGANEVLKTLSYKMSRSWLYSKLNGDRINDTQFIYA